MNTSQHYIQEDQLLDGRKRLICFTCETTLIAPTPEEEACWRTLHSSAEETQ